LIRSKKVKVHYQTNTDNYSFIKMHLFLKENGIKNNKFFLKIYDKSLIGVDPYSENLTLEQKAKIVTEVKRNYWYFIREIVKISVSGGKKRYELHRGNLALSFCLLQNINSIIELPRQRFKTMSICTFYLWLYNYATKNSELMLLNKQLGDCRTNLKRIKDLRDNLPDYLQMINLKDDVDNIGMIESATTSNKIVVKPSAVTEIAADGLGRGCTQSCQWLFTRYC